MKITSYLLLIALLLSGSTYCFAADDEAPLQLKKKPTRATSSEKRKETSDLDNKLLDELTDSKKEGSKKGQRLEQMLKTMIQIEEDISRKKIGNKTQQRQQSVIKDLEWMIQQVEQRLQQLDGTKQITQQQSTTPQQNSAKPNTPNGSSPKPQTPSKGTGNKNDKSPDSDSSIRKHTKKELKAIEMKMLEKDVWGHLPPTLRKKLLNIYSEKYLPEYDDVVRQYFKSLAEEGRKQQ